MSADSDKERRWLLERYASMPTEQLLQITSEPESLTDVARALLEAEIQRRGNVSPSDLPSKENVPAETD